MILRCITYSNTREDLSPEFERYRFGDFNAYHGFGKEAVDIVFIIRIIQTGQMGPRALSSVRGSPAPAPAPAPFTTPRGQFQGGRSEGAGSVAACGRSLRTVPTWAMRLALDTGPTRIGLPRPKLSQKSSGLKKGPPTQQKSNFLKNFGGYFETCFNTRFEAS